MMLDDEFEERVERHLSTHGPVGKVRVFTALTDDFSLAAAAEVVEATISDVLALAAQQEEVVTGVQVVPASQSYSLPDLDHHSRDFHYTDTGFLVVVTYR